MAEGIARDLGKGVIEPYGAGLFAHYIQPKAIQVMREIGIDISDQKSEAIDNKFLKSMDIITKDMILQVLLIILYIYIIMVLIKKHI